MTTKTTAATIPLYLRSGRVTFTEDAAADVLTVQVPKGATLETAAGRAWLFVPKGPRERYALDAWDVWERAKCPAEGNFAIVEQRTARDLQLEARIRELRGGLPGDHRRVQALELRKQGHTQMVVGRVLGVDQTTVSKWEREARA